MATQTNEVDVWQYEVPVIIAGKDGEFDVWQYDVPVEDVDSRSEEIITRRRAIIF